MAKVSVIGNAVVFQSEAKLEDLKLVKKYRPEALCVKGGEDEDEILFVCTTADDGMGDVTNDGAVFAMASHDDEKKAVITKLLCTVPEDVEELKNLLADKLGAAVTYMTKLEKALPKVLEEVKAERDAVMQAIEIA